MGVGFLLDSPLIVFHSMCVFRLWSQCPSRCSFHMPDLCVCMAWLMSLSVTSKSVPASTRLEDPSGKGTTRTAKSAPFNPCPSREGPYSTVFSVSRPMDPPMWLAGLLALSGDVKTNPGPTTQTWTCDMCSTKITGRQTSYKCNSSPSHWVHKHCTTLMRNTDYTPTWKCNIHNQQNNTITDQHHQLTDNSNNMQQNLNINQPHSINNNKTQQQINSKKTITIIQININGLTTKIHELKNLTDNTKIDIITIQETKLKPTHRTPYLKDYTAIRTDRTYKNGGGLMTYIKNDIIFTELKTPHTNNKLTELQHIKIHLANHKHLNIFNIYIPPRDTTNPDHSNSQEDITNCMTHILNTNNAILTGDFNAHHTLWHSPTTDNRGTLIADLINSSNQIVLNTNTPTRIPTNRNQQATSPDISTASNTIYNNITWSTLNALNSDHNPIKISYNTKTKFRLIQHRSSYTNYRKADWQGFTNSIENALTDTTDVTFIAVSIDTTSCSSIHVYPGFKPVIFCFLAFSLHSLLSVLIPLVVVVSMYILDLSWLFSVSLPLVCIHCCQY